MSSNHKRRDGRVAEVNFLQSRFRLAGNLLLLLLAIAMLLAHGAALAAETRVLDRLEPVRSESEMRMGIRFNLPMRFVSLKSNPDGKVLQVIVQPVPISGFDVEALSGNEELTWQASKEMPLERVRYEGPEIDDVSAGLRGQQATLVLHFSRSVTSYQLLDDSDFRGFTLVLPVAPATAGAEVETALPKVPVTLPAAPARKVIDVTPVLPSSLSPLANPDGRYVVNLLSQDKPIDGRELAPIPQREGFRVYTMEALVKGAKWHRLRLGFFASLAEARAAAAELKERFPQSWVDKVRASERSASSATALNAEGGLLEATTASATEISAPAADSRQTQALERAREAMTNGDFRRAIRFLTSLVEAPEHAHSREALELLGLARERNRQFAHANGIYEDYLERYPEGEGSDRVRQRLAGLSTAADQPREPLRRAKREEKDDWEFYGSVSQHYRREATDTDIAGTETTRSELDSSLVATARRRTAEHDIRAQFTGSYSNNFLDEDGDDGDDESRISELYIDWFDRRRGWSARAGRQRHNTSGTLGRFDGALVGKRITPEVRVNMVVGRPVENSTDTFINDDKYFYGISTDLGTFADHWDFSAFLIEQTAEGVVDRRAIGGEVRYFDDQRSLFSVIDYDLLFEELNTVLLLGNWTFDDNTTAYVNLDYRNSPTLTTSNALISQTVTSLDELELSFTLDEIRQFAIDRTQRARLLSVGGSRPLSEDLQMSADFTLSNLEDTEESGGVPAVAGTENQYYYTVQLIRSNLLKRGDIGILGLQYADGDQFDTVTLNLNSRYPLNDKWRINPRIKLAQREGSGNNSSRTTLSPFIRAEYRMRRRLAFEVELGGNYHDESTATGDQESADIQFSLGYRWDF